MAASDDFAAFKAASQALNDTNDKELRRDVYASFRQVTKPLGQKVIKGGAAKMPRAGGFAATLARARMGQSNATTGRSIGVALTFKTSPGHDLKTLDAGVLRKPVFPRPGFKATWVTQAVPARAYSAPFEAGRPAVSRELVKMLENVARNIAHKTSRAGGAR